MTEPVRFLLVGHCGPDASMLRSAIRRAVPDAVVELANDEASLDPGRRPGVVWLVNRALDGEFAVPDGVELIRRDAAHAPCALVTNLPDAMAASIEAGGEPGFGKRELNAEATYGRLRSLAAVARGG